MATRASRGTLVESQLATLTAQPAAQLTSSTAAWTALDKYVTDQGYTVSFGYDTAPKFMSNRVDFADAVFNPVAYLEFSTISLK